MREGLLMTVARCDLNAAPNLAAAALADWPSFQHGRPQARLVMSGFNWPLVTKSLANPLSLVPEDRQSEWIEQKFIPLSVFTSAGTGPGEPSKASVAPAMSILRAGRVLVRAPRRIWRIFSWFLFVGIAKLKLLIKQRSLPSICCTSVIMCSFWLGG